MKREDGFPSAAPISIWDNSDNHTEQYIDTFQVVEVSEMNNICAWSLLKKKK